MAFTFNGFGTKFYGEGDLRPDGSFTTTEWITAAYIPVVPLRSFRLARAKGGVNVVVFQSQSYAVYEKLPIFWPQVGRIYAFVACTAAWWASMGWLSIAKLKIFDGANAAYWSRSSRQCQRAGTGRDSYGPPPLHITCNPEGLIEVDPESWTAGDGPTKPKRNRYPCPTNDASIVPR
jgi:hypothetical protein